MPTAHDIKESQRQQLLLETDKLLRQAHLHL
jgi:hypothetical protein